MITPKNWSEFQHYKDRSPPWIKLHRGLLDNYEFHQMPDASRALAPMLWLLASEYTDGKITLSVSALAFRFRLTEQSFRDALKPLVDAGFFMSDSDVLATCKRDATPETEAQVKGETEILSEKISDAGSVSKEKSRKRNDYPTEFQELWNAYPTDENMSKKEAFDVWKRLPPEDRALALKAMPGFRRYCKQQPDYRPIHLCRFLSKRRFDGYASEKPKAAPEVRFRADPHSAEFMAWKAHARDAGNRAFIRLLDQRELEGRAFEFESQWPPGHQQAA